MNWKIAAVAVAIVAVAALTLVPLDYDETEHDELYHDSDEWDGDLRYETNMGELEVKAHRDGTYDLTLGDQGTHEITSIVNSLNFDEDLRTLRITGNVDYMYNSFNNCPNLETVVFLESEGTGYRIFDSFNDCPKLTSIVLPDGLSTIDDSLNGCGALESLTLPDGCADLSVSGLTGLERVEIGESCVSLRLDDCPNVSEVIVPEDGELFLEDGTLYSKERFSVVYCMPGVDTLHIYPDTVDLWDYPPELKYCIVDPGNDLFRFVDGMLQMRTGGNTWGIRYCPPTVDTLHIREDVRTVYTTVFLNGIGFDNIVIDPGNDYFVIEDGLLTTPTVLSYLNGSSGIYHMETIIAHTDGVPSTVHTRLPIWSYAFAGCDTIEHLVTTSSVEDCAFMDCDRLVSASVAGGVGSRAFAGCDSLVNVDISDCMHIYPYAFEDTPSLDTVRVARGDNYTITMELDRAFEGSGVRHAELTVAWPFSADYAFKDCANLESVEYSGVVQVGMFMNCTSLRSVDLDNGVSDYAFMGSGLTSVTMGGLNADIGYMAFAFCEDLESFSMTGRTFIGDFAFKGCVDLSDVSIVNTDESHSVVNLGVGAFDGTGIVRLTIDAPDIDMYGSFSFYDRGTPIEIVSPHLTEDMVRRYAYHVDPGVVFDVRAA